MPLTKEQLNGVIRQIGVEAAAAAGVFHDLPYSTGSGGSSNVRMVSVAVTQSGPPGSGSGTASLGFSPAPTQNPFIVTSILVAGDPDYDYVVTPFLNDTNTINILVSATWVGTGSDPDTAFPMTVGVRAEPFVAS